MCNRPFDSRFPADIRAHQPVTSGGRSSFFTQHALALSLLLLDKEPRRYERAAARFAALYVERVPVARLDELAAVVALLSGLRCPDATLAAGSLAALWRQRHLAPLVRIVERWEPECD